MKPYFKEMTAFGSELSKGQITSTEENLKKIIFGGNYDCIITRYLQKFD